MERCHNGRVELPALVDALERALVRRGVRLREEALPALGGAGGHCVVHGVPTVLLSTAATLPERADVLLAALRWVGPGDQWLPPAIRERL